MSSIILRIPILLFSLHREELPACCPDEHELCHLGPPDDEHPTSLQLPGAHEPAVSRS